MNVLCGIVAGTGHKLHVLIDEHDTFANDLLSSGQDDVYSAVTGQAGFVRNFYRALKAGTETGAVGRLFLTGASPILLDDLYTGFNIVTNISQHARFFNVLSEKELAQGYCGLFPSPTRLVPGAQFAWMLEIKYLSAEAGAGEIDAAFKQAEAQLRRYLSDAELVPAVTRGLTLRAGTLVFVSRKEVQFRAL